MESETTIEGAPTKNPSDWLSVWLGKDEKKKLRMVAAERETTMSKLARELIASGLDQMTDGQSHV
jgi:hypothetical protein